MDGFLSAIGANAMETKFRTVNILVSRLCSFCACVRACVRVHVRVCVCE